MSSSIRGVSSVTFASQEVGVVQGTNVQSNVEDNEETPLLSGRDIRSRTLPWQHDNAFIRLPSQLAFSIWQFVHLFIRLFSQTAFSIYEFVLPYSPFLIWCLATIALCGALVMEIKEGRFNTLLFMLCTLNFMSLAICGRRGDRRW
ncbi:hypothetical protein N5P37_005499 [Trichoderma harzianum]|nr:hypothetical protein N5P37_005499 [Trichoderma harzianum]